MATKKYILSEIKKGYNICWFVASQSYYTAKIRLYDDTGKTYFDKPKNTRSTNFNVIDHNNGDFTGNTLYLSVDIPESREIKQSITSNLITDNSAEKVGQVYAFCIEDSTDEDYNDLYINIVGWSKKG